MNRRGFLTRAIGLSLLPALPKVVTAKETRDIEIKHNGSELEFRTGGKEAITITDSNMVYFGDWHDFPIKVKR